MKHYIAISFLLFVVACDTSEPSAGGEPSVQFAAVDASCTEVWLQVKMLPGVPQRTIRIQRDSTTIFNSTITAADTLIVDEGLLPDRLYRYSCVVPQLFGKDSLNATITTLDTTSHNWTFVVDTIGGLGSLLRDVWIARENDVWAVGEIYAGDPSAYNVARWDGQQWTLSRATLGAVRAVYGFSSTDVWVGTSAPYHWNGTGWLGYNVSGIFDGYISKIWGTSSSNLFIVGTNGSIAHFDGSNWQRMPSPTDVDLLDVWGSPDGSVVWACGWEDFRPAVLLRYQGGQWLKVFEDPNPFPLREDSLSGALGSGWAPTSNRIFLASNYGVYSCPENTRGEGRWFPATSSRFPFRIRGNNIADFFIAGSFSQVSHFNGKSWFHYDEVTSPDGRLRSVMQKGDRVVAVGEIITSFSTIGLVVRGSR